MTNQEVIAKTAAMANAWLDRQLEDSELSMRDQGATPEELEAALGPYGWWRKRLERDRDEQIHEVERWLAGKDNILH
jgi:hypothetical protein